MALKIGSQPISCDGREALQAVAHGLAKSANRPIDTNSLKVRIKRVDGSFVDLEASDSLELSACVAAPKSTKKDKPAKPVAKPADKPAV